METDRSSRTLSGDDALVKSYISLPINYVLSLSSFLRSLPAFQSLPHSHRTYLCKTNIRPLILPNSYELSQSCFSDPIQVTSETSRRTTKARFSLGWTRTRVLGADVRRIVVSTISPHSSHRSIEIDRRSDRHTPLVDRSVLFDVPLHLLRSDELQQRQNETILRIDDNWERLRHVVMEIPPSSSRVEPSDSNLLQLDPRFPSNDSRGNRHQRASSHAAGTFDCARNFEPASFLGYQSYLIRHIFPFVCRSFLSCLAFVGTFLSSSNKRGSCTLHLIRLSAHATLVLFSHCQIVSFGTSTEKLLWGRGYRLSLSLSLFFLSFSQSCFFLFLFFCWLYNR